MILKLSKGLSCICFAVFCVFFAQQSFAKQDFSHWLQQVKQEAIANGISAKTANATVRHIQWLPKVVELDKRQPEFVSNFLTYYHGHVTPHRLKNGRKQLQRYRSLLATLEKKYGVPKSYLMAFWGLETNYGHFKGNIDTVSALATLAYDGRREAFFKAQLFDAMHVIDKHGLPFSYLSGSWAGAFGHLQFMPSTFKRYAINGDQNPRIDIKRSLPDAMYSAANYLSQVGWQKELPSVVEVKLPEDFPYAQAHLNNQQPLSTWHQMGVVAIEARINDASFAKLHPQYLKKRNAKTHEKVSVGANSVKYQTLDTLVRNPAVKASILLPQGWQGPAFMVFDNFHTILEWNRSVNYALCVSFLAKQFERKTVVAKGHNAPSGALSRLQMQRLQKMLIAIGFDPGPIDGYPGLKTQAAIRAYQQAEHIPADGYASLPLYYHLDRRRFIEQKRSEK